MNKPLVVFISFFKISPSIVFLFGCMANPLKWLPSYAILIAYLTIVIYMPYLYNIMKKEHVKILICPYCHGELELEIFKEEGEEILEGILKCKNCGKEYEIKEGIPKMI